MPNASAALCLSGSVRTLFEPCVLSLTLLRVGRPLSADLFAFVNVPAKPWVALPRRPRAAEGAARVADGIRSTARSVGTPVKVVEVDEGPSHPKGRGVDQARGLLRCWQTAGKTARYRVLVRVRTDTYHGFVLPAGALHRLKADAVYAGFLGGAGCARSVGRPAARWVDDRFAILSGKAAQRAYLLEFARLLNGWSSLRTANGFRHLLAPECLVGCALSGATQKTQQKAVGLYDVRQMISNSAPRSPPTCEAATQIIRSNCSTELRAAPWACREQSPAVLAI